MVKSAESVVIARPADEVFRFVADLRNEPTWHVDVASVPPETDPVPVVGKTYALTFKPFMGKTDGTFTALEVEPGARVVYLADFAELQPRITYTVEPASGCCSLLESLHLMSSIASDLSRRTVARSPLVATTPSISFGRWMLLSWTSIGATCRRTASRFCVIRSSHRPL